MLSQTAERQSEDVQRLRHPLPFDTTPASYAAIIKAV